MNLDSIPVDLITEILSKLPAKSIARFHCVSKLWSSILRHPYFTDLFLTRSSAQPCILFAIEKDGVWSFFSMLQCQSSYKKPSSCLVVTAKVHMKFPPNDMQIYPSYDRGFACSHTTGLIYFSGMCSKGDHYGVPVICNPNTGQYLTLPYLLRHGKSYSFLGFDPIDKQFKVLFISAFPRCYDDHKIITLGPEKLSWRTIKCPLPHDPLSNGVCINGVLYYLATCQGHFRSDVVDDERSVYRYVIVCFDVRSEKFKFIYLQKFCTLINYKGKLCVVYWEDDDVCYKDRVDAIELRVWVLEDAEKQEWSKSAYSLRGDKFFFDNEYVSVDVVGVTTMGDIILSMDCYTYKSPFYVFYFNLEMNTLQRVEIQGFGEYYHEADKRLIVCTFVDHVEDLKVNDPELLNSRIYVSDLKKKKKIGVK